MKKILISAAMLLFCATISFAQDKNETSQPTPEQKTERMARMMADKLLLGDATTAKFVPVYQEYLMTLKNINAKYKPAKPVLKEGEKPAPKTDADIDAQIRSEFAKSQEILDTRKAFYERYLKILTPKQVREMYKIEREKAEMAKHHKGGRPEAPRHPQN